VSRIAEVMTAARKARRAAFVAYVTAGDPDLERTPEVARSLRRGGADVLELGIPFSDPIADGPTNQLAAERALAAGTTVAGVLEAVREIRTSEDIPVVLFTYANPVLQYGVDRFAEDAAAAGVDGVLFTDVPAEEMDRFRPALGRADIDPVLLVTPTSTKDRIKAASKLGRGFLYLVSRTGVTGARSELEAELAEQVRLARKLSRLPVVVGFGISTAAQVARVAAMADGVVVGSAIVERIAEIGDSPELADAVQRFVTPLVEACRR
jgi:tryptophan synthase alpha chain